MSRFLFHFLMMTHRINFYHTGLKFFFF